MSGSRQLCTIIRCRRGSEGAHPLPGLSRLGLFVQGAACPTDLLHWVIPFGPFSSTLRISRGHGWAFRNSWHLHLKRTTYGCGHCEQAQKKLGRVQVDSNHQADTRSRGSRVDFKMQSCPAVLLFLLPALSAAVTC